MNTDFIHNIQTMSTESLLQAIEMTKKSLSYFNGKGEEAYAERDMEVLKYLEDEVLRRKVVERNRKIDLI